MHHHCEIILPPTDDVESAIANIMAPFREENEDEETRLPDFWDWYQIGGRWSGRKLTDCLDEDKLKNFHAEMENRKVTVSGLRFGKQELSPASQIPMVDALWAEHFPGFDRCPLFKHAGDDLPGDILRYGEVNSDQECERLIIAGFDDGRHSAEHMTQKEFWNGVTFIDSAWDGRISSEVAAFNKRLENYAEAYRERMTAKDDWLVVTVDCHS